MNILVAIIICALIFLFFTAKTRLSFIFLAILNSVLIINFLNPTSDFYKIFFSLVTMVVFLMLLILVRTFPSLLEERKSVGSRAFLFYQFLIYFFILSLLAILYTKVPQIFHAKFGVDLVRNITGEEMLNTFMIIAMIFTVVYSILRENQESEE